MEKNEISVLLKNFVFLYIIFSIFLQIQESDNGHAKPKHVV